MRVCLVCLSCSTRVLSSSGQLGVPRVEKPHVTEPKPFNLRSDSRARVRRSHEQPTMQQAAAAAHFRAQPLNRSILDGPVRAPVGTGQQPWRCATVDDVLCASATSLQLASNACSRGHLLKMTHFCLQTFKPTHKEKQGLTKPVSPELLTKRRAAMVRACSQLSCTYLKTSALFPCTTKAWYGSTCKAAGPFTGSS